MFPDEEDILSMHHFPGADAVPAPGIRALRYASLLQFAMFGLGASSWISRLPSIKDSLSLSDAQLGTLLLFDSLGGLSALAIVGATVGRLGVKSAMRLGIVLWSGALLGIALAITSGSVVVFSLSLVLLGAGGAATNIPLNIAANSVGQRMHRENLSQFHAFYSIGAALGASVGAAAAALRIPPPEQVLGVALLSGTTMIVMSRWAPHGPTLAGSPLAALQGSLHAWKDVRTLRIGALVFFGSLSEGTANTWLTIAVVTGLHVSDATAASALSVFTCAMTAGRLAGPAVIQRIGRVRTVIVSGICGTVGLLVFIFTPDIVFAWPAIAAWGLGAALTAPLATAAAADDLTQAASRVAVAGSFGSIAQIVAPPALGMLSSSIGARPMLLIAVGALLCTIGLSPAVRPPSIPPEQK